MTNFDGGSNDWLPCFQVIAFDDLKTDYKNPIDLCQTLNPVCICFTSYVGKSNHHLLCIAGFLFS